ncbi:MAG: polyprenyl synthetase family protein [Chitinophagaceae bacterium]|nr:polyprenyl synthetase family protein [Chitinophagaceae bacterium]
MSHPVREFEELAASFEERFQKDRHPAEPEQLYKAAQHLLLLKGKRVRPVLCLMATELFTPVSDDTYNAAAAIEVFHNFTLVHDDIMDRAPIRRGEPTVHEVYGSSTAILAGDVMLVQAYEYLAKINKNILPRVMGIFNDVALKVCEGQQYDMEFESREDVTLEEYVKMIELKTSVLLAAALRIGSVLGGAGPHNQDILYSFGRNMGIAFQIQDDYLDAFGDQRKFGKKQGGDIVVNKKTFLHIRALSVLEGDQKAEYLRLMAEEGEQKINPVIALYKESGVDQWAKDLKEKYFNAAMANLEEVAVVSARKKPLKHLAEFLLERQM